MWRLANKVHRTPEQKQRLREIALKRYAEGWDPKAGRARKYAYTSPIAGDVSLDGTWELKTAKWLDNQALTWRRNRDRFAYINLKGVAAFYTPDFYIEEWSSYLEVKGYETELDRCKWSQFPEKLIVWKSKEIHNLGE